MEQSAISNSLNICIGLNFSFLFSWHFISQFYICWGIPTDPTHVDSSSGLHDRCSTLPTDRRLPLPTDRGYVGRADLLLSLDRLHYGVRRPTLATRPTDCRRGPSFHPTSLNQPPTYSRSAPSDAIRLPEIISPDNGMRHCRLGALSHLRHGSTLAI